ncbi:unnamed protein product [Arctogadus glacialis]
MAGKLEMAFGGARQSGVQAHEKQKLYYDGTVRHTPYAVGDLVWLHNPTEDRVWLCWALKANWGLPIGMPVLWTLTDGHSRTRVPPMGTGQLRSPSLLWAQGCHNRLYPVREEL